MTFLILAASLYFGRWAVKAWLKKRKDAKWLRDTLKPGAGLFIE